MEIFIVLGILICLAIWFVFRIWRYGSIKGAMFGATIKSTSPEITGSCPSSYDTVIIVHLLERNGKRFVGFEMVATTYASSTRMMRRLTRSEAQQLISILKKTVEIIQGQSSKIAK